MSARILSTRAKLLASAALLAAAAGAAGLGTFGSFTSTTSASESVSSGTVVIALGANGTAANRLTVAATGIVPGDTMQRAVALSNTGDQSLSAITLTTTATTTSLLDTDPNGLVMKIEKCSTAWVEAGTAPAYTYTCTGTKTTVLAQQPIVGANLALSGLSSVANAGVDNLMVTMTLPVAADNNLQGKTSVINFAFTGTQRAATNK
jgi:spore coat-associated protein N